MFLIVLWVGMLAGLSYRLVILTGQERSFLQNQSHARVNRTHTIPSKRGRILDRQGTVLAMSEPKWSLWVEPKTLHNDSELISKTAELMGMSKDGLESMVDRHQEKSFMYLKRRCSQALIEKALSHQELPIHTIEDYDRYYPGGDSTAPLLGQVDIDGKGIEGVELMEDGRLSGARGFKKVVINRYGETVQNVSESAPKHGQDLVLTIDKNIQYHAFKALKKGVEEAGAKSGMAVVLDVDSGGVLAAVNYPSFDPGSHDIMSEFRKNRAFVNLQEPGSTFKPMSMSYVLEHKDGKDLKEVDTSPGVWVLNRQRVTDVRNYGIISVDDILMRSSNIGIAKLVLDVSADFVGWLEKTYPVGKRSLESYPGEPRGRVNHPDEKKLFDKASISYGYGISMTVLQQAQAYLTIANGGFKQDVKLVLDSSQSKYNKSERLLSKATVDRVKSMMRKVVSNTGTGRLGQVKGLEVAGKTGTTHMYTSEGYAKDRYIASFSGFAPLDNPKYVICIVVEEPNKSRHYGGQVAAPIFSEILFQMLYLDAK